MRFRTLPLSLIVLFTAAASDGPISPGAQKSTPVIPAKDASIRVDVAMTLVPVTVIDNAGRSVTGLDRENFRLFDNKKPRDIASFSREDQPVSVGIIFDCSRSMSDKFHIAREAPVELLQQLNPGDESFVVTVAESARLQTPFTNDLDTLRNSLLFINPNGSTALIDGVFLGLAQLKKAHNPRRALVVVSDGGDNNSRYTMHELRKITIEADAQIFTIGLHTSPRTPEEVSGPELLGNLSQASGGTDYIVHRAAELTPAMARISATLHNEYVLGYYPGDDDHSGKFRPISVELLVPRGLPPLRVFARAGYYTPQR
jgi:Ca-activated chloride channel family protein